MAENDNPAPNNTMPASIFGLGLVNTGLSAQIGMLLQSQIPASDIMNMLCEQLGAILCLVEPEQLRNEILGQIRRNLPGVLNRHVTARQTTPGGILRPSPGELQH